MMLALIGIIALILWITNSFGQSAGAWAIGIAFVVLLVLFCKAWGDDSKAHYNWVKYWKDQ